MKVVALLLAAIAVCAAEDDGAASMLETSTETATATEGDTAKWPYFGYPDATGKANWAIMYPWFDPFSYITAHMNFGHYALIQTFGVEAKSREMIQKDLEGKGPKAKSSVRFIWPYPWPHDPFIAPTAISMGMF